MTGSVGPESLTALGALVLILVWFTRRADRTDSERSKELADAKTDRAAIESRLDNCQAEVAEQRRDKHAALNRVAFYQGRARLTQQQAKACTCGAMAPLLPLFDDEPEPLT